MFTNLCMSTIIRRRRKRRKIIIISKETIKILMIFCPKLGPPLQLISVELMISKPFISLGLYTPQKFGFLL